MKENKSFPLDNDALKEVVKKFKTPFYLYDERAIRENVRRFLKAFSIFSNSSNPFIEHFAVKACPNPYILKILMQEGCGADAASMAELVLCEKVGFSPNKVIFSSNDTPKEEYIKAFDKGYLINLDDLTNIKDLQEALGGKFPPFICFRYNPGALKSGGNDFIGKPLEAKYGMTGEQIIEAVRECKALGVKEFGLHIMVASNELNPLFFKDTAKIVFNLALDIYCKEKVKVKWIDLGGGVGIPYKPGEEAMDYNRLAGGIKEEYDKILVANGVEGVGIKMECGRPITGPYGYLVSKAIHTKSIYREYIGLDSSMADLMRPGMYGAYHAITVSGKEDIALYPHNYTYDITGGLCENCDKFAVQRALPKIDVGDLLIIHDAGAHGRAMGFNYNGKLRAGELLLRESGEVVEIRRRESLDDYFSTVDFSGLEGFN